MSPLDFFLNKDDNDDQVVTSPAFSLTKVMAVVAPLVTALTTFALSAIKDVTFDAAQITTMIVALIAFLAVTAAADVLARGIATSAEKQASGRTRMLRFDKPLVAKLVTAGEDSTVKVLAASDADPPEYLCLLDDGTIVWKPARSVVLSG